ncbi:MAG TPA: undecaprenyldiphospho-muramoylpentapeptide beta-N-acetylglucosaminyltransferase [Longimicrobiales bacterium]|nr:undecaprenyldiphospho-muramoylpentapeptide beta-N-acetylglucosaminyltransferase [Longimicrobiales bacterium]
MHEGGSAAGPVVVFSGGGTGGHLYPALALADALASLRPDVRPFFVGASRGLEARVLPARGVPHLLLPVRGVARREGWRNWRVVPALLRSLDIVAEAFQRLRPELVVVTGGYAGAPAGVAAAVRGVPLVLQEQNSVPGVTTRLLARRARVVHVAFPEAAGRLPTSSRSRVRVSGNPVRPPVPVDEGEARRAFGLPDRGPVVLVVGGSQGSRALNRALVEAVRGVVAGTLERPAELGVLWSTGPDHLGAVRDALGEVPEWVRPVGYVDDMHLALGSADLAVSRAGAMATSEFLAWGVPMVLVPLPTAAADHQTLNARALADAGAAVHLPEAELTGEALWRTVTGSVGDSARLEAQRKAARERGRPHAARRIAATLADLLSSPTGWSP